MRKPKSLLFISWLLGTVIVAYLIYLWQRRTYTMSSDFISLLSGGDLGTDWKLMLNRACHAQANRDWCVSQGHEYDVKTNTCSYNKQKCETNKNYKKGDSEPYRFWDEGNQVCLQSNNAGLIKSAVCGNDTFRTAFSAKLGYNHGKFTCDKNGYCNLTKTCSDGNNLDSGVCPTCIIPSGYCKSKGLDHVNLNGLGDCRINNVQVVFESIFGKTLTRQYKQTYMNMQKECAHRMLSWNCTKSIGTFSTVGGQIVLKSGQKYMNDLLAVFKKNCSGDFAKTTDKFVNCYWSMIQASPMYVGTEMGIKMMDTVLNQLFGWLGIPIDDVMARGIGYCIKFGKTAVYAVLHFGRSAVDAIDKAGVLAISYLDKIGISRGILDATGLGFAMAGMQLIGQFGGEVAKALAQAGQLATHIVLAFAEAGAKVINCAVGAVLHPQQFVKGLYKGILSGKIFEDAVVGALHTLKKLGLLFKETLDLFVNGIKMVGEALADVYKAVVKALGDLKDGLVDAGKAIGNAIASIF